MGNLEIFFSLEMLFFLHDVIRGDVINFQNFHEILRNCFNYECVHLMNINVKVFWCLLFFPKPKKYIFK